MKKTNVPHPVDTIETTREWANYLDDMEEMLYRLEVQLHPSVVTPIREARTGVRKAMEQMRYLARQEAQNEGSPITKFHS